MFGFVQYDNDKRVCVYRTTHTHRATFHPNNNANKHTHNHIAHAVLLLLTLLPNEQHQTNTTYLYTKENVGDEKTHVVLRPFCTHSRVSRILYIRKNCRCFVVSFFFSVYYATPRYRNNTV